MDAQIEELQAELNNQREVGIDVGKTVNTPDKVTGDTVDNAVQDAHIGNNVKPETKPEVKQKKKGSVLLKAFFFILILSIIIFFLLMEVELNVPVLSNIQNFPEVQGFKQNYYVPFKENVRQKIGY